MLNLLTAEQTRQADQFTISSEPVASIELMERAALAFVATFSERYPLKETPVSVYCGTGNNGGDGLAIARILLQQGYQKLSVKIVRFSERQSEDFSKNYDRIRTLSIPVIEISRSDALPVEDAEIIIDALLGTGLNKPLENAWKDLVLWLNGLRRIVISVDIPTGFRSEGPMGENEVALRSDLTITFQRPKITFLLPESGDYTGEFVVVDIGLNEEFIQRADSPFRLLEAADIRSVLRKRKPFSHKGTYGHALLIAGSAETMGAALLCAEASVHAGAGLTSACIPPEGLTALNTRAPEVLAVLRKSGGLADDFNWQKYDTLGVGPGLGTSNAAKAILEESLSRFDKPSVFDADALNLISRNYELISFVPEGSVLTPHMKEFDRLFGEHANWWDRLKTGMDRAKLLNCVIVLKNRYTILFNPDGTCLFNPGGTPAMATGGTGDVLTGIVTAFLAQGYTGPEAAMIAVYVHALAGETLAENAAIVPASQLIGEIPKVIARLTR